MKRLRAPQRRESAIQAAVLGCLRAHGVLCWPLNRERAGYRRASHIGFRGLPDIGGVLTGGRAVFVEVKRGSEQPSAYQRAAHEMLRAQGALVFTAWGVEDVAPGLREIPPPTMGGQPISWATARRISRDGP